MAAHAIRLLRTGIEFLNMGKLNVYRTHDAEELLDIKLEKLKIEEIKSMAIDLFEKAKVAKKNSFLPEKPNYKLVNELVEDIVYKYIKKEY